MIERFFGFIFLLISLFSLPAYSCGCGVPQNDTEALKRLDIVIVGRITEVVMLKDESDSTRKYFEQLITVSVDSIMKGNPKRVITISYPRGLTSCHTVDYSFKKGQVYVLGLQKKDFILNGKRYRNKNYDMGNCTYARVLPQ